MKCRNKKGQFVSPSKKGNKKYNIWNTYRIRFCVPKTDRNRKKLEDILTRNNIKFTEQFHGQHIAVYYKELYEIFKECGDNAYNKHIPPWVLEYDSSYLKKLWEGLMDGDGNEYYTILTTVSPQLVADCIELGWKIGKQTNFIYCERKNKCILKDGREIRGKGGYYINFNHTQPSLWRKNLKRIEYKGKVWCISTRNGNFLISREGKTTFTGNSMARYGHGNFQPPFSEEYPANPVDVYGVAKVAAENVLRVFSEAHGLKYVILVPHNIYGPRSNLADPYRNVLMIWINRLLRDKPFYIYGDGTAKRAPSYIEDIVEPCIRAGFDDKVVGEVINIGASKAYTLNEIAKIVLEEFPSDLQPIHLPGRICEVKEAYCTVEKSIKLLGYRDKTTLREGIRKTIEWAKEVGPKEPKYLEKVEIEKNLHPAWRERLI